MRKKTLLLALAVAVVVAAVSPPVRSTAKSVLLLSEVVPSPVKPLHSLPAPRVSTISIRGSTADLYVGGNRDMPGIVLVHGVARGGPADPRVREIATGFNRLGRTVLAPSLALGDQRLDPRDPERIRRAIEYLSDFSKQKVLVLAFSFGAGFTMVALAQEPEIQSKVLGVVTVGTYYDLVHLLEGVTTGRVTTATGASDEWRPDPRAPRLVVEFLGKYLVPGEADELVQAYDRRDPSGLSLAATAIYRIMTNTDHRRTRSLVSQLGEFGQAITDLSPAGKMDKIRVPLLAMHSREDPASPPSESAFLVEAVRPHAEASLTLVGSFRHVTPARGTGLLRDAIPLINFTRKVFAMQESWRWFL